MTYAIVAEERSGRRIVGSVALSAVSCVASRRRIVAGAISAWRVIGCAIVVRPTERAADNGAAEESGSKAPTKSPTPHRLHIACGRLSDRKRIDERRGRCHIGGTRSTRCEHCGDRYVEHSPGHWLSPSFRALGSGLRGGYTAPQVIVRRYATEIRLGRLIRQTLVTGARLRLSLAPVDTVIFCHLQH